MKFYFTCGQKHVHFLENSRKWDKNSVIQVTAKNCTEATDFVYEEFGQSWCDVFTEESDIENYYPNGVVVEYEA